MKEHDIEWVYHIPCHATAFRKVKQYGELLKIALKTMEGGILEHWDTHSGKATQLVNTGDSASRADPVS